MSSPYRYIILFFGMFALAGCETMGMGQGVNVLRPSSEETQMVDMPVPLQQETLQQESSQGQPSGQYQEQYNQVVYKTDSVEVFDMELNPTYSRGVDNALGQGEGGSSLVYAEEFKTRDPSVTIFGVGDAMPHFGAHPYNNEGVSQSSFVRPAYGTPSGNVAGQIFFKHGSSRLGAGDIRKISGLADQAKFSPVNYVTVSGHASKPTQAGSDSAQAQIINLRQSIKRSEKVTKALIKKGVPGEKLKTVSWGSAKATGKNQYDRRVDVVMGEQ